MPLRSPIGLLILSSALVGCQRSSEPPWQQAIQDGTVVPLSGTANVDGFQIPPPPASAQEQESEALPEPPKTKKAETKQPTAIAPIRPPVVHAPAPSVARPARLVRAEALSESSLEDATELIAHARQCYESLPGYRADLVKLEFQEGMPRRQTIRIVADCQSGEMMLQWQDTYRAGRKVRFNAKQTDPALRVELGAKEPKILGKELTLPANGVQAALGNKYAVTKLGLGSWIDTLERIVVKNARGDYSSGEVGGIVVERVTDCDDRRMLRLTQTPSAECANCAIEPGGCRFWYLDLETSLPMMVVDVDSQENVLASYRLTNLEFATDEGATSLREG